MSEVNWDLAPEGAEKIIQYNDTLTWAKDGYYWSIASDKWEIDECAHENTVLVTRPTQTKTVEDAVEYHKEVWPNDDYDYLNFDSKYGWYCSDKGLFVTLVCTREQFEACAAKKGEKLTHVTSLGKCKIIQGPNKSGQYFLELEGGVWDCLYAEQIKPIKPTISESEAIGILKINKHLSFSALLEDYDVVKD